jgi:hypothetical protein
VDHQREVGPDVCQDNGGHRGRDGRFLVVPNHAYVENLLYPCGRHEEMESATREESARASHRSSCPDGRGREDRARTRRVRTCLARRRDRQRESLMGEIRDVVVVVGGFLQVPEVVEDRRS